MCGIHLILDKQKQLKDETAILSMLRAGKHRGPDAQHFIHQQESGVWLAGNRLQIVDHDPAANQPFCSQDGRYTLVFNGEIYNFYELRNELLQQGEQFITSSDTEVLFKWLIREGKSALNRLNGMFALAFYDRQRAYLLAARDKYGMKPCYYTEDDRYLLLSSETKSLFASGLSDKKLNASQVNHYLRYKYAAPGQTFYQNTYQLLPGQLLEKTGTEPTKFTSYQEKSSTAPPRLDTSPNQVISTTRELLTDAVIRHLSAAVPTGIFLSGGVDSTLLLAIIQKEGLHPIPSFSIVNDAGDRSFGTEDYLYASKAAEQFGSKHYELQVTPSLVAEYYDTILRHTDQPIADSGAFMTYLLSKEAKKEVGVVLSGAGADELFAGYHRHEAFRWYLESYNNNRLVRQLLPMSKWLPTGFGHPLRKEFRLLKKLGMSLSDDPNTTLDHFIGQQFPWNLNLPVDKILSEEMGPDTMLEGAISHDLNFYLPHDVLAISDMMSMACSLEMRMPYLDTTLADFVQTIPAKVRLSHGRKWILTRLLYELGGKAFTTRKKEGFGLPLGNWIRKKQLDFLTAPLEQSHHPIFQFVPYDHTQTMLQKHQKGHHDYSQQIWTLGILAGWLHKNF